MHQTPNQPSPRINVAGACEGSGILAYLMWLGLGYSNFNFLLVLVFESSFSSVFSSSVRIKPWIVGNLIWDILKSPKDFTQRKYVKEFAGKNLDVNVVHSSEIKKGHRDFCMTNFRCDLAALRTKPNHVHHMTQTLYWFLLPYAYDSA